MKISEVTIDNRNGMGATPYNQEINYRGLRVLMKPSVFLDLAVPLPDDYINTHLEKELANGAAIGAPFLIIEIPEAWFNTDTDSNKKIDKYSDPARVVSHEGRNRMTIVRRLEGDNPIETHLFFRDGIRNRDLTPEIIKALNRGMYKEQYYKDSTNDSTKDSTKDLTKYLQIGPLFSRMVNETLKRVKGKWALVSKSNPKKVLQYYHGSGHPSKEWVSKVERRVHSFSEGVGRITPQNVTQDVGLNQTSIEAAKFGNKVNRDGYPALLMRKKKLREAKEPGAKKLGDCFKAAYRFALNRWLQSKKQEQSDQYPMLDVKIVHAMVNEQDEPEGRRFPHAWNEIGNEVYDTSNGGYIRMRKEEYYKVFKVNADDPKEYRSYTFEKALTAARENPNSKTGNMHYGPWELDVP